MSLQEFATTADLMHHYVDVHTRLTRRPWSKPKLIELARWQEEPQDLPARRVTVDGIITAACAWFKLRRTEILSHRREMRLVYPRHIVMYLAREMTSSTLPTIGRMLGDRDHTTVLVATRKIGARMANGEAQLISDIDMVWFLACARA